jgi:uncharacterized membrane protein
MILILIGYKGISDEFGDIRIWRNIVLSVVFYALSFLVLLVSVWYFRTFLWNVFNHYFYYFEELFSEEGFNEFLRYISFRALVFAILFYAFLVLSSFFFYRANKLIGDVTGNNNFRVGGLLVLVSTILFPIIIGIIIYPVGLIILIVAFFGKYENIKDKKEGDDVIIKL